MKDIVGDKKKIDVAPQVSNGGKGKLLMMMSCWPLFKNSLT